MLNEQMNLSCRGVPLRSQVKPKLIEIFWIEVVLCLYCVAAGCKNINRE